MKLKHAQKIDNTEPVAWNIYLREIAQDTYEIIMPDETTLTLPNFSKENGDKGFLVRWPLNPYFTGRTGIACILQGYPDFKHCKFLCGEHFI